MESIKRPSPEFYDQDDSDNLCYLCETPDFKLRYEVKHFGFPIKFQECGCGLVKQTPMPNEKFFEWFFNSDLFFSAKESKSDNIWGFYDYFKDEPSRLVTSRKRYEKLKYVFEVGRPLEIMKIGPSTGTFLYIANQHKHHAIGCDLSSRFVEHAKNEYSVHIDNGRFEYMDYKDEQFDVIMLFNVIENIPNPAQFLTAVNRKLKKGGYFILNFVDMKHNLVEKIQKEKYFLYRPPVCYIYDKELLERALVKFGFEIASVHRDIRSMHLEKILTLLGWNLPLKFFRMLRIHQIPFSIYAYPSRIVVARRTS